MRKCAAGGGSGLGKLQQLLSDTTYHLYVNYETRQADAEGRTHECGRGTRPLMRGGSWCGKVWGGGTARAPPATRAHAAASGGAELFVACAADAVKEMYGKAKRNNKTARESVHPGGKLPVNCHRSESSTHRTFVSESSHLTHPSRYNNKREPMTKRKT